MKKITAISLLYALASVPAYGAGANTYAPLQLNMETPDSPAYETRRFIVERIETLSKFSLLQVDDNFSLYGKLSFPRIDRVNADSMIHRNAATYGLRGQFQTGSRIGIRFGWDRYIAGQNANDNLYSLTAVVRF
jgi:hypothetical protein